MNVYLADQMNMRVSANIGVKKIIKDKGHITMKKILFCFFILVFTVEAKPLNLSQSLEAWSPKSITIKNEKLVIITNEAKVTEKIYNSILLLGVCRAVWGNGLKVLEGATEIEVLNKHKRQGYIFEGGAKECEELGKLKDKESEFFILGRTHLH